MTKIKAILLLIVAGLCSIIIAMAGVVYGAIELGALIYMIIPIIVTIVAIIAFLAIDRLALVNRKQLIIIFSVIILLIGVFLRFDFYCNIINW